MSDGKIVRIKKGDHVTIKYEGREVKGECRVASPNGKSLAFTFDAMLGGYVGMMPVLVNDRGEMVDLIAGKPVEVRRCA